MTVALTVVGDVHGTPPLLEKALADIGERTGTVVFVGDYINRGPDSREVIELLLAYASSRDGVIFLRGNHEDALLRFLQTGTPEAFLRHGGLLTIKSYLGARVGPDPIRQFCERYPPRHRRFLEETRLFYETEDVLVSHCGLNPESPEDRTLEDMVLGSFPGLFASDWGGVDKLTVCGHYVQRSGKPFVSDRFICLDSGCGSLSGGSLSCLLLPEGEIRTYGGRV